MRSIGLHLRLKNSLIELLGDAVELQIPIFQCFLVSPLGFLLSISDQEIEQCRPTLQRFEKRYLHASYWSNLASVRHSKHRVLLREFELATRLGFTHIVIHPGSAKGAREQREGINAVARVLNSLLRLEHAPKIVLENVAHGKMSVGGNFKDFKLLLDAIHQPENISFCVDTAHAYSYGYNIADAQIREEFIHGLQETITLQKIELIHLNDTYDNLGSHRDRHAVPGEGKIGEEALKSFVLDTRLRGVPLLLEPPELDQVQLRALVQNIAQWHKE